MVLKRSFKECPEKGSKKVSKCPKLALKIHFKNFINISNNSRPLLKLSKTTDQRSLSFPPSQNTRTFQTKPIIRISIKKLPNPDQIKAKIKNRFRTKSSMKKVADIANEPYKTDKNKSLQFSSFLHSLLLLLILSLMFCWLLHF